MTIPRSEIHIPDHEVLRKIGGGAYGEVWMARGVTGALRAVKIVWREDFEDERGFEREFEGILKFEPISRDHPGFVNILHVGRGSDESNPFYYYVMELGDDVHTGRNINPVEYEARTLRSDLKASIGRPLEVEFCLDVGGKLSEALKHLHSLDLAHRDIKPATVIFVDGKAKLADIGLVASRGQQTFVGTEGFVPPEGPGSGQADIYSLGKVLYEMATGKDRLQFPELPDRLPDSANRKQWLALNRVICSVCEPKLNKRSINSAKQLSDAISKIRQGKRVRERRVLSTKRWVASLLMFGLVCFALIYYKPWNFKKPITITTPVVVVPKFENEMCSVQFITNPLRAKVFENGLEVDGETPTAFRQYPPGTKVHYMFEKPGYKPSSQEYEIPDKKYHIFKVELSTFKPPKENQEWVDSLGVRYFPRVGFHESGYIQEQHFKKFLATKPDPKVAEYQVESFSERGVGIRVVLINKETAEAYTRWVEDQAKQKGLLRDDQYIVAKQTPDLLLGPADMLDQRRLLNLYPTLCIAKAIPFATLDIKSDPEGARVFVDGEWLGVTPMVAENLRPQKIKIVLRKDGYKGNSEIIELSNDEERNYFAKLQQNNGVVMKPDWEENAEPHLWTNNAGVKLVQFAKSKMVSIWEVRIKDYMEFTQNTGHRQPKDPLFPQTPNHPIVGVSKQDAIAYCKWLTLKDREADRIGPEHEYRLPTDAEWSELSGLKNEKGKSPAERYLQAQLDSELSKVYPWGKVFPPRRKIANLADAAAAKAPGVQNEKVIANYNDGFVNTAAVGSLLPNKLGIHDLSGNVYEWVSDVYNTESDLDVARGGSWASHNPNDLKTWSRFPTQKEYRDNLYGFRYVLVDTGNDKREE